MELNKGHIAFSIACFVAGAITGAGLRSCARGENTGELEPTLIHDTITLRDTTYIAGRTKTLYVTRWDTLYIKSPAIPDSTMDSLCDGYVTIPIETKEYRDTFLTDTSRIELGVRYTGYRAKIDAIDLNSQYTIQPRTIVKKNGWGQFIGIGIGVGYGASVVEQTVYAAPEVGIHITYGWGYHW